MYLIKNITNNVIGNVIDDPNKKIYSKPRKIRSGSNLYIRKIYTTP